MNIINTISNIDDIFISGHFDLSEWKKYMDLYIPGAKEICLKDMMDCQRAGYTWGKDYLPILDGVYNDLSKIDKVVNAFAEVTQNLNDRIYEVFNQTLDVDIYLYLGLCNGAGWVTEVSGKTTILLGIEKIIEVKCVDDETYEVLEDAEVSDSVNDSVKMELRLPYRKDIAVAQ